MVRLPKYLILRFAPGAAGNMISSLLQCSPEVAHWNMQQQDKKPNNLWLDYFKSVFPVNLQQWLYHEPVGQLQWGTRKIFSAKYDRGNGLSVDEFLAQEKMHCTEYYHSQKNLDRYLPIFWHKSFMPAYFENSRCIIVHLDADSLRWFDHAVYHKHHEIVRSDKSGITVRLLENRPEIAVDGFDVSFEQEWSCFREFVRERIVDNRFRSQYLRPEKMDAWNIPSMTVRLSDLLCKERITDCYRKMCIFLKITPILDSEEIRMLHGYWRDLHAI